MNNLIPNTKTDALRVMGHRWPGHDMEAKTEGGEYVVSLFPLASESGLAQHAEETEARSALSWCDAMDQLARLKSPVQPLPWEQERFRNEHDRLAFFQAVTTEGYSGNAIVQVNGDFYDVYPGKSPSDRLVYRVEQRSVQPYNRDGILAVLKSVPR